MVSMLKVETWHVFGTFPVPCKLERGQTGNSTTVSATLLRHLSFGTWNHETTLHTFSKYQIRPFGIIRIPYPYLTSECEGEREREREEPPFLTINNNSFFQGFNKRNFHSFSLLLPVSVCSSSGAFVFCFFSSNFTRAFGGRSFTGITMVGVWERDYGLVSFCH